MTAFRRWWPLLLLVAVLPLAFPGALPGPRVVSADDHLTVHPAFQEVAGGRVRHPAISDPALQFEALENAVFLREVLLLLLKRRALHHLWVAFAESGVPAQNRVSAVERAVRRAAPPHVALRCAAFWHVALRCMS